jgi:hypothetical protein
MKAKSTLVLALAAGAVTPAFAGNEPVLSNGAGDVLPIAGVKHVYINLATGERVVSDFIVRASPNAVWDNTQSDTFFHGLDNPNRSTADALSRPAFGAEIVNWGDLRPAGRANAGNTRIDGYEVAYATGVGGPGGDVNGDGIIGYGLVSSFYENDFGFNGAGSSGVRGIIAIEIADIAGNWFTGTTGFGGWIYTIDLEGTTLAFNLADSANGDVDVNGDGFPNFSYGYQMVQDQTTTPKAVTGPFLVRPAGVPGGLPVTAPGAATGDENAVDWYKAARTATNIAATGLFNTDAANNATAQPYAATHISLFSPCALRGADYDGSGFVDSDDFVLFNKDFEEGCTGNGSAGLIDPNYLCGTFTDPTNTVAGNADFDATGFVDSDDFAAFVRAFEAGCAF